MESGSNVRSLIESGTKYFPKDTSSLLHRSLKSGRLPALLIFLPPALLLFTLFVSVPLIEGAWYAGFKWDGYSELNDFRGLRHFEYMAGHKYFHIAVWNTILFVLAAIFIQVPVGLAIALLIYKQRWSNSVFRLIFFLPFIIADVATGLIWSFIFDGDYGAMAFFTKLMGTEKFFPLSEREWALPALIVVFVWKYFGFHMMIFVAALQNVPASLMEAARIDGATRFQIVRFVQIPMLRSAINVSIFFAVIGSIQIFDLIVPLTSGGPGSTTNSLVSYLFYFGIGRQSIGFGSAVGIVLFVVSFIFAITYRSTVMKADK